MPICPQPNCSRFGWPTLDQLCLDHYRDLVAEPAWSELCASQTKWHNIEHAMWLVECASGLRATESLSPQQMSELVEPETKRRNRARIDLLKAQSKQIPIADGKTDDGKYQYNRRRYPIGKRQPVELLVDDEEIINDL